MERRARRAADRRPQVLHGGGRAIDAQVKAAEAAIASGDAPDVADDSYLRVGDAIGDLALVYDWCLTQIAADRRRAWLAYAYQAVWNVWHSARREVGRQVDAVERLGHRRSVEQLSLLVPARDDAARPRRARRDPDGRPTGSTAVPRHQASSRACPDVRRRPRRRRLARGHRLRRRRCAGPVRALRPVAGVDRRADRREDRRTRARRCSRSCTRSCRRSTASPRPAITRATRPPRSSTTTATTCRSSSRSIPDDPVAPRAQALLAQSSVPEMENRFMFVYDFLYDEPRPSPPTHARRRSAPRTTRRASASSTRARAGTKDATWINLIAGPYTQSHAHQDQGSLMIYKDGWLAYDANVDSHSGLHQDARRAQPGPHRRRRQDGRAAREHDVAAGRAAPRARAGCTPRRTSRPPTRATRRCRRCSASWCSSSRTPSWSTTASRRARAPSRSGSSRRRPSRRSPARARRSRRDAHAHRRARAAGADHVVGDRPAAANSDFRGGFRLDDHDAGRRPALPARAVDRERRRRREPGGRRGHPPARGQPCGDRALRARRHRRIALDRRHGDPAGRRESIHSPSDAALAADVPPAHPDRLHRVRGRASPAWWRSGRSRRSRTCSARATSSATTCRRSAASTPCCSRSSSSWCGTSSTRRARYIDREATRAGRPAPHRERPAGGDAHRDPGAGCAQYVDAVLHDEWPRWHAATRRRSTRVGHRLDDGLARDPPLQAGERLPAHGLRRGALALQRAHRPADEPAHARRARAIPPR